jgi:hypothetical protein
MLQLKDGDPMPAAIGSENAHWQIFVSAWMAVPSGASGRDAEMAWRRRKGNGLGDVLPLASVAPVAIRHPEPIAGSPNADVCDASRIQYKGKPELSARRPRRFQSLTSMKRHSSSEVFLSERNMRPLPRPPMRFSSILSEIIWQMTSRARHKTG